MNILIYNKILLGAFVINLLAVVFLCLGDTWMSILTGSLVSFIFYYVVVYIPAYIKKENLKKVFLEYYSTFKEDILREVLVLTDFAGEMEEKISLLEDANDFTTYYREQSATPGQTNWDVLMNNLTDDKYAHSVRTIVQKVSELQREVDFIVRTAGVQDSDLLKKFRNLDRILQDGRYKENLDGNLEEETRFAGALRELLSGWSMISGANGDFVKKWIKNI